MLPYIEERCVMDISERGRNRTENKIVVIPKKRNRLEDKNQNKVKLEHVLGLTVSSNAALDCDCKTGTICYPAGCTIIFLSPFREKQTHLLNTSRKSVTCLVYSPDGRYLATGEYGHQPSVRIWDLTDSSQCAEFGGHKCGINCVVFSPNQKYLVSIGSQHDMIINIWDWKSHIKIGSNKVSAKIKAVSFSESGDYFVTVGNRHVKFWYLQVSRHSLYKDPIPIMGRSAILGEQRNNDFVDVVCGKGEFQDAAYVITKTGILCEFNGRRLLDRWVDIKTISAYCIATGENLIFIGCADSIIRCFSASTLEFVTTLPRTHYLGVDVASALTISHTTLHPKDARYPDTIALTFDEVHKKLTAVYNDHSLYIWDVRDIKKVGKSHSYLYHCSCIWGVEVYPDVDDDKEEIVPPGTFITCSSDDTVRFWNLDKYKNGYDSDSPYQPNIYSNELTKIIYVDPDLQFLRDTEIGLTDKAEHLSYDGRSGVRSLAISSDGLQLASGDRSGNIRIYDLKSINEVCKIEAHDAEVLCLEFSPSVYNNSKQLLVSASRDRLIHLFDATDEFEFMETLDDHSSSITAVRFLELNDQLQLVSCSADKSIVFRKYQNQAVKDCHFIRDRVIAGKTTLYDMAVDCSQKYILTACQDRNIRVYNVNNGKHCKTFKGSIGEEGSVIKIALDNSGRYLATSCTDKTLCIYDYYSGECIACISGHSELVTGLRFSNNCEHLISASGDGCIFIWRLPRDMVVTMQARLAQQLARSSSRSQMVYDTCEDSINEMRDKVELNKNMSTDAKFNDGQFPLWVTKSINDEPALLMESVPPPRVMLPKGRWAQRLDYPLAADGLLQISSNRESDGSKEDSSIDSGTETCRPDDHHENLIIPQKTIRSPPKFINTENGSDDIIGKGTRHRVSRSSNSNDISRVRQHTDDSSLGSFKNEDIESTEHDGDIEDYSEVESAGDNDLSHKVIYYPSAEDALSEFKVNAIDEHELRKSQRKIKKISHANKMVLTVNADVSSCSVSGSQESDDDDDASTPSADNSEKNHFSLVSSGDNVDAFEQRELYLKNTYESLSGNINNPDYQDKKTISSQHHSYNVEIRNVNVIQAAEQNRNDVEVFKKRQELKNRIDEIKDKLQCVGYQSSLKSSQSTLDLRKDDGVFLIPSVPIRKKKNSHLNFLQNISVDNRCNNKDGFENDTGMRRSCSLSDLVPSVVPPNSQMNSQSNSINNNNNNNNNNNSHIKTDRRTSLGAKQPISKHIEATKLANSMKAISRSSSELSLAEGTVFHRRGIRYPSDVGMTSIISQRIMRPTISSQNKSKLPPTSSSKPINNLSFRRRLPTSISYMALNEISNVEDSSSEDNKSDRYRSGNVFADKSVSKRTNASKFLERSCSERDLSSLSYSSSRKKHSQINEAKSDLHLLANVPDVTNSPLSRDLLHVVLEQFRKTADNIVCMHERLTVEHIDENEKKHLLAGLRNTVNRVQYNLRRVEAAACYNNNNNGIIHNDNRNNNNNTTNNNNSADSSQSPVLLISSNDNNNNHNLSSSSGGNQHSDNMLSMIQQYSDVLVSLVQKKVDQKNV